MHKLYYILPAATAVFLIIKFPTEYWWGYLVVALVLELLLYLGIKFAGKSQEYLSGYATGVEHHEAWTERVVTTETYTDSKGNTKTRTKVTYIRHPDKWLMYFNTGRLIDITSSLYYEIIGCWQTQCVAIFPVHINCVSGGGGQRYKWDSLRENAYTTTYKGLYTNYIINSNSIFKAGAVSDDQAEALGLVEYPKFSGLESDAVLVSPHLKISASYEWERDIRLFNAFHGLNNQIHVFVILFNATSGLQAALSQREYWRGGNKNEFTICLGLDDAQNVKWCKAFSWCDLPQMETALESWYLEHTHLDFKGLANWLEANVSTLWKRKEFKDFKYLGKKLTPWKSALVGFLTLAACALFIYIAYYLNTTQ